MERAQQLRNVSFGGSWSQQIAGREEIAAAVERLRRAAAEAARRDPRRSDEVVRALHLLCQHHPKGPALESAWARAAGLASPAERVCALGRIASALANACAGLTPR